MLFDRFGGTRLTKQWGITLQTDTTFVFDLAEAKSSPREAESRSPLRGEMNAARPSSAAVDLLDFQEAHRDTGRDW